jgi:hypothetical protein
VRENLGKARTKLGLLKGVDHSNENYQLVYV